MTEDKNIEVGGRLHSIATGNVLAGADEIFDDDKNKKQSEINTETYSLINDVNERLTGLSPDQQSALSVATKATNNEVKLGYYVCDTAAATAAKVISDATGYVLSIGGSIKIKMTNANTAANATLNINSTGAKPLYYDGERASATNSWEAGETVEVYYDGTNFYANNTAGGGKFSTGEKVKDVGLDDEPTEDSPNLVKSGGLYPIVSRCIPDSGVHPVQIAMILGARTVDGNIISHQKRATANPILEVKGFERVVISIPSEWYINPWYINDDNTIYNFIADWVTGEYEIVLDGVHNIVFNARYKKDAVNLTQELLDSTNWTAIKYREPHSATPAASYIDLENLINNFDELPTQNSPNPVKSGGVFLALSIGEGQEVPLSISDYFQGRYDADGNVLHDTTGRISTSEYLTSGNVGDLIHNNTPSTYKVFIWIRKSASRFVQFIDGEGWTTEDIQIPANTDYFITIGRVDNSKINTASYGVIKVVTTNLVNHFEKLEDELREINESIVLDDLPQLTQDDYDNITYNAQGQTILNNKGRISTKNYYNTGHNSHVLHLTDESHKLFVWYRISANEFVIGTDWTTEDFIVPPHTDYYITIALISNDNISTSDCYCVARHLLEKNRVINLESRVEKLESAEPSHLPKIVWSQWNVGQFAGGAGTPNITAATYNKMAVKWNKEVFAEDADVFGMIEYNPVFGKNTSNVDVSPDDVVWNAYQFKAIFRQPQIPSYWGGTAILSKIQLENQEKIKYSCYDGITAPDAQTQGMMNETAFMTVADMVYMGVKVKVVETVVAFNFTTKSDNTYQRMAYQELATRFGNEPFVIIAGDMECVNREDYEIFTDAGFTICNGGDFGWFTTCVTPLISEVTELDNIIVKGFNVTDVRVSNSNLSDHYPLIATLEISEPS